ncbi:hypothetical protein [Xenorhabdus innexi]|uniref:Uncharacterized protein n=1 Tax=Xenorhabdus innexi TaxID=290109 RepID=A0A1N6MST8_9GAMM|nr:hypothetical protein [Xenorhabdus innexi]PHM37280.1 hypothetical protein Xinn_00953 [Xenorhabdus innexi]SIP71902.1 hypothetical protein XIS1_1280032 [Xenorhabdus innexi]
MKYLKFFPEGFYLFEDVPHNATGEPRLTIVGHGVEFEIFGHAIPTGHLGTLGLGGSSFQMGPRKLVSILNQYVGNDLGNYRHIRLLICYAGDKLWYRGGISFAGRFSQLLPNPDRVIVEAYKGKVVINTADYDTITRGFAHHYKQEGRFVAANRKIFLAALERKPVRFLRYDERPKDLLTSVYPHDVNRMLFGLSSRFDKGYGITIDEIKRKLWDSFVNIEKRFDSCEPVQLPFVLSSRVFFCNGKSSTNINDFR